MPVHGLPPRSSERSGASARRTKPRGRLWPWLVLPLAPVAAAAALVLGVGLTWNSMVRDDGPATRAGWTLVLDGWVPEGERAERGAALLREGRTDSVLLSGSRVAKALWNSTFHFHGLHPDSSQRGRIGELRHNGTSTLDEAYAATEFFRARGVDTVLLVTSDYHTDRAGSIFERVAGGKPVYLMVPAQEARFAGPTRERTKTWLMEALKRTHWSLLERWTTPPLEFGARSTVAWSTALHDSAGQSPLLRASCPPPVVCPAPIVCPPPPEPVIVPCPEPAKLAPKASAKASSGPAKPATKGKEPAKAKASTDAKKKPQAKEKDKR